MSKLAASVERGPEQGGRFKRQSAQGLGLIAVGNIDTVGDAPEHEVGPQRRPNVVEGAEYAAEYWTVGQTNERPRRVRNPNQQQAVQRL